MLETSGLRRSLATAGLAAFAFAAAAATAQAAPPFVGGSYASTTGPGNPVIGGSGGPVRVGAHLPSSLACSEVVSVETAQGYYDNPRMDFLRPAPVVVTLEQGRCGNGWSHDWVRFTVPHPRTSDILGLIFQDSSGRTLYTEKLAISNNGSPSAPGAD